jgi:DNA-binding NtrC family response regulator
MISPLSHEILIVDDEAGIRELLSEILADEGYRVVLAENAREARAYRQQKAPALVLLDIWMPDTDGVTLLREWVSAELLTMPVVMMSGHATIETAVSATRIGAFDFLEKPIGLEKLLTTVRRALRAAAENNTVSVSLSQLGNSSAMRALEHAMINLVRACAPILILGESGSGHATAARALQNAQLPWVTITPQRLAGHPLSLLEEAREGILYCPEIGQLTRVEQKGLLFLLSRFAKYEITLVCTSSEPLGNMAAEGEFDPTLLSQLSAGILILPPLREHREDIPLLIERKWKELTEKSAVDGSLLASLSPEALTVLSNAYWPGNIDQLYYVLENLALLKTEVNDVMTRAVLGESLVYQNKGVPPEITAQFLELPLRDAREAFERYYFERLLATERNNMSKIAEHAGLERTHLYRKLKQLDIRFTRRQSRFSRKTRATTPHSD